MFSYKHFPAYCIQIPTLDTVSENIIFSVSLQGAKLTRTFLKYWYWRPNLFQSFVATMFPVIYYPQKLGLSPVWRVWRYTFIQSSLSALLLQNSIIPLLLEIYPWAEFSPNHVPRESITLILLINQMGQLDQIRFRTKSWHIVEGAEFCTPNAFWSIGFS